jgi:hypothetical protein
MWKGNKLRDSFVVVANKKGSTMSDVKFDERWFEGLHGADLLSEKLCQVTNIEGEKDDLDHDKRFLAALMLVADLIGNTQCASCRAHMAKLVRKLLPEMVKEAMQQPITEPHLH